MSLANIIASLEGKAIAALDAFEAEAKEIVAELVPVLEDGLAKAVDEFGALACDLVLKFLQQEFENLTGAEKHGEVVTHLAQEAEAKGKALAIADAQALAKNAFLVVSDAIQS